MTQVMHEADLAKAMSLALASGIRGVFNVTGPGEIPISVVVRQAGCKKVPLPATLLRAALGRFGLPDVGEGVLEFLKHPCLLDGSRFAAATGFTPDHDLASTLHSVHEGRPLS
jgi:UDP-glucose 4-epimerase